MSLEERIEERIAYLKNLELEELKAIDAVTHPLLRRSKWDFINEICARRHELENILTPVESQTHTV